MKINWGTSIVLAFVGFISFIMYFIITMNVDKAYDHELVTEDYYGVELAYQNDIDRLNNANTLSENVSYKKTKDGLVITFPKGLDYKTIEGKVILYRPSSKKLDFETPISLTDSELLIKDKRLLDGRWDLRIEWEYQGKPYLFKEEIHL
ncbi:FixH family protein [Tamlana sp. 2_MG-2023]|uniref:FixH family protein n=1 Tax=unclassified Tamlana TaxID=2614803 RepID=UPI0026E3F070|nr:MULTISPECIES: FixH family protein [unclassified Tamlana]MDO6758695.1 FixH family protein [Tamlana sp. 2_MG-2023]MDO6789394.1 FixH family protein [Tamlana sp. 1_MG-2023]